jgi:hypothetical protein
MNEEKHQKYHDLERFFFMKWNDEKHRKYHDLDHFFWFS